MRDQTGVPATNVIVRVVPLSPLPKRSVSVIAYADDVTIFVTRPEDFFTIQQAINTYERITGEMLNVHKSKTIAIENWTQPAMILGIGFHPQIQILAINFAPAITQSEKASWPGTIQKVRQQARIAYDSTLCLTQRIQYVQMCLLAKVWYLAQILPPTKMYEQQLTTICSWFIWKGATLRVSATTLQRPRQQGG
jgi:hypothetical protein